MTVMHIIDVDGRRLSGNTEETITRLVENRLDRATADEPLVSDMPHLCAFLRAQQQSARDILVALDNGEVEMALTRAADENIIGGWWHA